MPNTPPTAFPLSIAEEARLATCDTRLQALVHAIIDDWNIAIIFGHRTKEDQDKAFKAGNSKLQWPNSKHNTLPSKAIDMLPVEIVNRRETVDWKDRERMHLFAGYVLGKASNLGINLRWGGDWDQDTEVKDNGFDDLAHFELRD